MKPYSFLVVMKDTAGRSESITGLCSALQLRRMKCLRGSWPHGEAEIDVGIMRKSISAFGKNRPNGKEMKTSSQVFPISERVAIIAIITTWTFISLHSRFF